MANTFSIGNRLLSHRCPPYLIAEIGVNHNGDLNLAKQTIDAAANAGAHAVKFQTFRADEFMADQNLKYRYESKGHQVEESMYEMFKRLELPEKWHAELQSYAHQNKVEFLSSAADTQSADLLVKLGAPILKIASEDLINLPLLKHIASLDVPVILSTGMADQSEIDRAVSTLNPCPSLLLLHCVSLYPTPDNETNLLRIPRLGQTYNTLVGFSDHTLGCDAAVGAVCLGAVLIEKHFTLDRTLPGPDHALSSDPAEFSELAQRTKRAANQLGTPNLAPTPGESMARKDFRRSIVAASDIPKGCTITQDMLHLKRPGTGIHPQEMDKLLGRQTNRQFEANEQLDWNGII